MARSKRVPLPDEPSDAEVRAILVQAIADVGGDPPLIYAFRKTGVYVCHENEKDLPLPKLKAFNAAVEEYHALKAGLFSN